MDKFDYVFVNMIGCIEHLSTCDRGHNAALIVKDNRPISMGYAGSLPEFPHCDDVGHDIRKIVNNGVEVDHCMRTVHAERNAIFFCAKNGIPTHGAYIYCTTQPCRDCAAAIIMCGIKRVICKFPNNSVDAQESSEMLRNSNVELIVLNDQSLIYSEG